MPKVSIDTSLNTVQVVKSGNDLQKTMDKLGRSIEKTFDGRKASGLGDGNAGLPARNSNNSTGNSNWNGSAGSPGLVWGQSAPCTENIYCAVYSAPIGKIVLKPAEASSCGERHRRHKPRGETGEDLL